ncbi:MULTISPECIES: hypothetical protein [Paraclostridium]|jgi:hypothetical protein|uniref:Uncharacterized protein n=1 Tax=Paraclostridium bifermentans TaxID=1490 RepID=A0ABY8R675_PARBF|nr:MULTISPECIES: hypothetical protein [Paraclostridium]MDV8110439.1 hypothetical protein [Bacillus sp. BAU-SS-2023]MCR1875097.1 hypothetical protein [Paraclostridium bifermentans]MDU0295667.1 hypothetical protein [Paraclostridium sp. MRS3W1]MDU3801611.1 hypothetical protein [Paraclostridium bifermentans]WGX76950.1 hypothetical protein QJS64_08010 [Paraclostridium bifermentans]
MNISGSIRSVKKKQSKLYTLLAIADVLVLAASFGIIMINY